VAEDLWRDVALDYDRSFATLCAGTADALLARVPAGADLLDVGCGSGHLTAAAVAAGHHVIGVDPDPQMLALAASRAGVPLVAGGLPDLPVADASCEALLANFVLNHVDDPRRAASGLRRVLVPGGSVVATIWGTSPPPHAVLWGSLLDQMGAVRPDLPRLDPALDFSRTPDGLAALLAGAGLEVTEATTHGWTWSIAPDDLWAGLTAVGNFGVTWRAQDDATHARLRAAYDVAVASLVSDGRLELAVECVLVTARRDPDGEGQ